MPEEGFKHFILLLPECWKPVASLKTKKKKKNLNFSQSWFPVILQRIDTCREDRYQYPNAFLLWEIFLIFTLSAISGGMSYESAWSCRNGRNQVNEGQWLGRGSSKVMRLATEKQM